MNNIQKLFAAINPTGQRMGPGAPETVDRLPSPATAAATPALNNGPLPDAQMPWGLRPNPAPAHVSLEPVDAEIASAYSDLDAARKIAQAAQDELSAARSGVAALGSRPQPNEYQSVKEWSGASAAWDFDTARQSAGLPTLEQRAADASQELAEPTARLSELNLARRRAICENDRADLDMAGQAFVAQLRIYRASFAALDGPERSGLSIGDTLGAVRSAALTAFGDNDRIEATFTSPAQR